MVSAPSEIALPAGRLRRFLPQDIDAFAALNADPVVMEFFPHPWSFEESEAAFKQVQEGFSERGFGVYALESKGEFSGIVGLSVPSFKAYFTPCVEILFRVMERLGMERNTEPFFDHPAVSDDRLRRHILYKAAHSAHLDESC